MVYVEPYNVAVIQMIQRQLRDEATKWDVIRDNTKRICELIIGVGKLTRNAKLVVLPEFSIAGNPGITWYDVSSGLPRNKAKPRTYKMMAIEVPNEATDKIGDTAVEQGCYVAVPFIEKVKDWPDWPFNSSALISPKDGKVVLVYRKHCGPSFGYVPPADIYSEYVKKYGEDSFFPVADTPIGKIGLYICCDGFYPETVRCLALRGAEVLCWGHGGLTGGPPSDINLALARVRAIENTAYVAMANIGGFKDSPLGAQAGGGYCYIVDYRGAVIGRTETSGEAAVSAIVDINTLRKERAMGRLQMITMPRQLYAKEYQRKEGWPLDSLEGKSLDDMAQWEAIRKKVTKKMYDQQILERPE